MYNYLLSVFQLRMSLKIITFGAWKVLDKVKLQSYYKKK